MLRPIAASLLLAIAAAANAAPNLYVEFQHSNSAAIGDVTGVGIDVTNYGTGPAANVVVTYTPAAQLTYNSYTAGQYVAHPDPTITQSCTTPRFGESGPITCTISTLPSENRPTVHFFFTFNVPASIAPGTTLTHSASAGSQTISFSNTAQRLPQLVVSHTYPPTVVAGEPYDFTLSIRNASSFDATNVYFYLETLGAIEGVIRSAGTPTDCLRPELPYDVQCSGMTIPAGDTMVFSITARTDPIHLGVDDADIRVSAADFFADGLQEFEPIAFEASVSDPAVTITAPARAIVNTPYSVHVSAYAAQASSVSNARLTVAVPAGTTLSSFAQTAPGGDYGSAQAQCSPPAGGAITCTISYLAPPYLERGTAGARAEFDMWLTPAAAGSVTQTATVSSAIDLDATNDSASATTIVAATATDLAVSLPQLVPLVAAGAQAPPAADLSVRVDAPLLVQPGDNVTYPVSLLNRGPDPATNVRLTVTLPSGATLDRVDAPAGVSCSGTPIVCSAASLASGATLTVNAVAHPPALALGTPLPVSASATSDTSDGNATNNRYVSATTIAYPTKLSMRIDPAVVAVAPNAQFVTTITVTNNGQSPVAGVNLGDVSPFALKVISVNATGNTTCAHASVIGCGTPVLNPGEQVVITAVLQAPASGTVTQKRSVQANAVDQAMSQVHTSQTVVTTAHPKHRAAP